MIQLLGGSLSILKEESHLPFILLFLAAPLLEVAFVRNYIVTPAITFPKLGIRHGVAPTNTTAIEHKEPVLS